VEDPRAQLIRELLDRERLVAIRRALPVFQARETIELSTYTRSPADIDVEASLGRTYHLGELGIYDLLDMYRRVLIRREKDQPMEVAVRQLRLSEVIRDILSRWLPRGVTRLFRSLLPSRFSLHQAVMTFLAVLELARVGRVRLEQSDPFDQLQVQRVR
jgi:segregation and condensation protein A